MVLKETMEQQQESIQSKLIFTPHSGVCNRQMPTIENVKEFSAGEVQTKPEAMIGLRVVSPQCVMLSWIVENAVNLLVVSKCL